MVARCSLGLNGVPPYVGRRSKRKIPWVGSGPLMARALLDTWRETCLTLPPSKQSISLSDKKEDAECLRLLHARAPHIASAHMTLNVHLLKEYARECLGWKGKRLTQKKPLLRADILEHLRWEQEMEEDQLAEVGVDEADEISAVSDMGDEQGPTASDKAGLQDQSKAGSGRPSRAAKTSANAKLAAGKLLQGAEPGEHGRVTRQTRSQQSQPAAASQRPPSRATPTASTATAPKPLPGSNSLQAQGRAAGRPSALAQSRGRGAGPKQATSIASRRQGVAFKSSSQTGRLASEDDDDDDAKGQGDQAAGGLDVGDSVESEGCSDSSGTSPGSPGLRGQQGGRRQGGRQGSGAGGVGVEDVAQPGRGTRARTKAGVPAGKTLGRNQKGRAAPAHSVGLPPGEDAEEEQAGQEVEEEEEEHGEEEEEEVVSASPGSELGQAGAVKQESDPRALPPKRSYAEMLAGRIDEEGLKAMYLKLPEKRVAERVRAMARLRLQQPLWHLLLRSGFSLLLHGLGSKRRLLSDFAHSALTDGAVVVINGWLPSVTAHKILLAAASAITGRALPKTTSGAELLSSVQQDAEEWPGRHLYLVVHNIEGPGLRSEGDQLALAQLAQCSNVHLVASVDHVAASLMWSKAMEAMFRWQWVEAHTYAPYIAETLDKPSVLVGAFQQARQRGAGAVLRSLVPNARDVFALLVDHQLDDPESEGLDFKLLFRMCRERFLLTSETALKSHITEFRDHELLATRRATDGGGEVMYVPMDSAGLQQVQAELESIKAGQDDA
ncbi:hypothetical protein QJQ45_017297 [Haematococcus lacustris]|nr:hypothetical protein QJQ45_017297 [Haematococcus lacustris]